MEKTYKAYEFVFESNADGTRSRKMNVLQTGMGWADAKKFRSANRPSKIFLAPEA